MGFYKYGSLGFKHPYDIPEDPLPHFKSTQRIREDQYLVPHLSALLNLPLQTRLVPDEGLQDQILVPLLQLIHQLLSGLLNVSGTRIADGGDIVHLHVQTVLPVSVLHKYQIQIHGEKRLQLKMPPIVVSGRVEILQAVQPVLQSMVINPVLIQIIAYGIRVAVHIHIPILPKIHRHKRLLQPPILLGEADTAIQFPKKPAPALPPSGQLRKEILPLLVKLHHPAKQPRAFYPASQLLKVIGHPGQHQIRFSRGCPLLPPALQLLQKGDIYMIIGMAYIDSFSLKSFPPLFRLHEPYSLPIMPPLVTSLCRRESGVFSGLFRRRSALSIWALGTASESCLYAFLMPFYFRFSILYPKKCHYAIIYLRRRRKYGTFISLSTGYPITERKLYCI